MKKTTMFLAGIAMMFLISACDDEDKTNNVNDNEFMDIANIFLTNTVYPTYSALADGTEKLVADLETFAISKSQSDLNIVCNTFLAARAEWELSEAFLFGAASDFGIDPHIDSWPLDEDAFNDLMASPKMLAMLAGDDGDVIAGNKLGNELLGFHGIEYILFSGGAPKNASEITDDEMIYAIAVAGDLRNRTAQLDVAWRGILAPKDRINNVEEELELNTTVNGGMYYGDNLMASGLAGSTFSSWSHAMQSILTSCSDICDEVGTSKIGKAHTAEDITYIESPYSQNSINDFYNNITSIANVYYGGVEGMRVESKSLHNWMKTNAEEIDAAMVNAIDNALTKIKAMKAPFVLYYADSSCDDAIRACSELDNVIAKAVEAVTF